MSIQSAVAREVPFIQSLSGIGREEDNKAKGCAFTSKANGADGAKLFNRGKREERSLRSLTGGMF